MGARPGATQVGLGSTTREGQSPVGLPCGWTPEAIWGGVCATCRGVGPQKPMEARLHAASLGLASIRCWGHSSVRPQWGWATKTDGQQPRCNSRGDRPPSRWAWGLVGQPCSWAVEANGGTTTSNHRGARQQKRRASEAVRGCASCDRRGAEPHKPLGAGPRSEAWREKLLGGGGAMGLPWRWALEAVRGTAQIQRHGADAIGGRAALESCGAGLEKPLGARALATPVGLGPKR